MGLTNTVRLCQLTHRQLQKRWVVRILIKTQRFVWRIPRLRQQRALDTVPSASRVTPSGRKQFVRPQVTDHVAGAVGKIAFVGGRRVCAKDREKSVRTQLYEIEAFRLRLGLHRRSRDLFQFSQPSGCGIVPGIPPFFDPLQPLAKLVIRKARVVLGQLAGKNGLKGGGLPQA